MTHVQLIHKHCGGPVEQTADGIWHEQRCRRCGAKKEWRDEVVTTEVELEGGSERLARGYDLAHGNAMTTHIHPLPGTEEHGIPVRLPPGTDGQVLQVPRGAQTGNAPTKGHYVTERGNDHD